MTSRVILLFMLQLVVLNLIMTEKLTQFFNESACSILAQYLMMVAVVGPYDPFVVVVR